MVQNAWPRPWRGLLFYFGPRKRRGPRQDEGRAGMVSTPKMRDFVSLENLSGDEITQLLDLSAKQKADPGSYRTALPLKGKVVGLFFEKASLRTRLSFETAVFQLGGNTIFMGPECGRIGERESLRDLAKVSARYLDAFVLRTYKQETITEMAKWSTKPVINGLSDTNHPCQALGDVLTIREKLGTVAGKRIVFVGDSNNVARSLSHAVTKLGGTMVVSSPHGYQFSSAFVKSTGIEMVEDPLEAAHGADVLYTDVWASMGQEHEVAKRRSIFQKYCINKELVDRAPSALVMHCLPAHRGDEIMDDVIDGPHSVVYDQAENRLHAQRALLTVLVGG
jgi:ornithine carbamoyltransferase